MRLTTQMQAEIESIRTRVDLTWHQVLVPLFEGWKRRCYQVLAKDRDTTHATIAELNTYKIRLENILCETDIKEQARWPMNLPIVKFFTNSKLNLVTELVNELV